jgi:hypothetical protein
MNQEPPQPAEARPAPSDVPPPTHIYRWDLDKTYLRTEFDTLKQLLRSAFEKAEDKKAVPGASALLRELRAGGGARICFISGSPKQMRRVLTKKLRLDGVEFDEFILKPNLRNMLTGRFRAMREQVGYKLPALLAGRAGVPEATRETCFGDDAEADGFIYSLYADTIGGQIERPLLTEILERAGVYEDDAERTVTLAEALPLSPSAVGRIFIHLDRRSPTARFDRYGARLVPIYNYFQAAMVLFEDRQLAAPSVVRVALEMVDRFDYTMDALRNSLQDLLRRGRIRRETAQALASQLTDHELPQLGSLPSARELLRAFAARIQQLGDLPAHSPPDAPIDYLAALEVDLPRKGKKRTDIAPPV